MQSVFGVHNSLSCKYIYIYIWDIMKSNKSGVGIIPSRINKMFKNGILDLNNPGQELNVNKIHKANNFLFKFFNPFSYLIWRSPVNILEYWFISMLLTGWK